jgi:hypothetical protein
VASIGRRRWTARLSVLLDEVAAVGADLADTLVGSGRRHLTLVAAPGTGKAAAFRHAHTLLRSDAVPAVLLEATDDELAPLRLLDLLDASLEATGYPPAPTDNAYRPVWDDRLRSTSLALAHVGDAVVVLLSGADQLERVAARGGTPGRHAADVLDLLERDATRLGMTTARPGPNQISLPVGADLGEWLTNAEAWGPLAPAAAEVADRGESWRRRSPLTVRLSVGLAHLGALPTIPPATALTAGQALAEAVASRRSARRVWAAWQLVAGLTSPLSDASLDALLEGLPEGARDDPLLLRCILFRHDGWRIHPILRRVAQNPPVAAARRALPEHSSRDAGRRMVSYFRDQAIQLASSGSLEESASARVAALDACAMAQDEGLAQGLVDDLPDPYDHIGREAALDAQRSRAAFGHALRIDGDDATAIRGIAEVADSGAVSVEATEHLFRRVIELEPYDVTSHYRLIAVLLAAGRPKAAVAAFDATTATCSGALSDEQLANRFLIPVARVAVAAGNLVLASRAISLARTNIPSTEAQELDRLINALVETLEYGEFVGPQRLGTSWWVQPEVLADFDYARRPLTRWLAARIDGANLETVTVHYADIALPADPERVPERSWMEMPLSNLQWFVQDELPAELPGTILEIGVYGDGMDDGSTVVRVVDVELVQLPEPALPVDRYLLSA